jgi:hypothetical protein
MNRRLDVQFPETLKLISSEYLLEVTISNNMPDANLNIDFSQEKRCLSEQIGQGCATMSYRIDGGRGSLSWIQVS